jgi:hypothetical protein
MFCRADDVVYVVAKKDDHQASLDDSGTCGGSAEGGEVVMYACHALHRRVCLLIIWSSESDRMVLKYCDRFSGHPWCVNDRCGCSYYRSQGTPLCFCTS